MKKILFLMCAFSFCLSVAAQEMEPAPTEPAASAEQTAAERAKMLYSLGFLLGDNLKRQLILDNEDDYKALSQGMRDSLLGKPAQTDLDAYKPQIIEKYRQDAQCINEKRETEQKEYLENFAKEKGVKVLDNGALIKLSKKGKGNTPNASSKVTVHYEGKLIDGTKFDSSYDRGETFTTALNGVIPCWTKALQQMRPASKATIVCPADTAYGNRPAGIIPPNSALVFEVELISVDN